MAEDGESFSVTLSDDDDDATSLSSIEPPTHKQYGTFEDGADDGNGGALVSGRFRNTIGLGPTTLSSCGGSTDRKIRRQPVDCVSTFMYTAFD